MSHFRAAGLDDLMNDLAGHLKTTDQMSQEMLTAGEDVIVDAWKQEAEAHVLTGQMRASIKGHRKKGTLSTEVYPDGKDSRGVRNADKAFIIHYGISRIKATHWVDRAEQTAEEGVVDAMEQVVDRYMGGG